MPSVSDYPTHLLVALPRHFTCCGRDTARTLPLPEEQVLGIPQLTNIPPSFIDRSPRSFLVLFWEPVTLQLLVLAIRHDRFALMERACLHATNTVYTDLPPRESRPTAPSHRTRLNRTQTRCRML